MNYTDNLPTIRPQLAQKGLDDPWLGRILSIGWVIAPITQLRSTFSREEDLHPADLESFCFAYAIGVAEPQLAKSVALRRWEVGVAA